MKPGDAWLLGFGLFGFFFFLIILFDDNATKRNIKQIHYCEKQGQNRVSHWDMKDDLFQRRGGRK